METHHRPISFGETRAMLTIIYKACRPSKKHYMATILVQVGEEQYRVPKRSLGEASGVLNVLFSPPPGNTEDPFNQEDGGNEGVVLFHQDPLDATKSFLQFVLNPL